MPEHRPRDYSGESAERFGAGIQESDYLFEYGVGYSPKIYEVTRSGKLKELPLSVQHLVSEGHIGKAIEKRAADIGQYAGVVFEISGGEARQVGNVEGNRHGAKITWSPSGLAREGGVDRVQNASRKRHSGQMSQRVMSITKPPVDADLRKRYDFFKTFGGGGRVGHAAEGSLNLARAERIAEERGWEAKWEEEQEAWESFLGDEQTMDDISSVLWCGLYDENGKQLASLGGIQFGHDSAENRRYRRYTEAELALEAADEKGLL